MFGDGDGSGGMGGMGWRWGGGGRLYIFGLCRHSSMRQRSCEHDTIDMSDHLGVFNGMAAGDGLDVQVTEQHLHGRYTGTHIIHLHGGSHQEMVMMMATAM